LAEACQNLDCGWSACFDADWLWPAPIWAVIGQLDRQELVNNTSEEHFEKSKPGKVLELFIFVQIF
jgi:hypothetical protein